MILPIILIAGGLLWYWENFGFTFDTMLSWGFFWPAVLILLGLVMLLKRRY